MNTGHVILVYRTNVPSAGHRDALGEIFGTRPEIVEWSIDLEDVDKVLRVVCEGLPVFDVAAEVRLKGFECEELE
jgi:hypothetical protein